MTPAPPHALLSLLFPSQSVDRVALCDRLQSAGQFLYSRDLAAAPRGSGGRSRGSHWPLGLDVVDAAAVSRRTVARGPEGTTYLVSLSRRGVVAEELRPQGGVAARLEFPVFTSWLADLRLRGDLVSTAVHQKELWVLSRNHGGTTHLLRMCLEPAASGGEQRQPIVVPLSGALPPTGRMLTAVDDAVGVAYMLACGSSGSLSSLRLEDQTPPQGLQELTGQRWPTGLEALCLRMYASKVRLLGGECECDGTLRWSCCILAHPLP